MEDRKAVAKPIKAHTVHIENRERASISGVEDVDNFNEDEVNFQTDSGYVTLTGSDLHITRLNLEEGQLIIEGVINGIAYSGNTEQNEGGGFFSRLFK
jgi:sporulation protein YabP